MKTNRFGMLWAFVLMMSVSCERTEIGQVDVVTKVENGDAHFKLSLEEARDVVEEYLSSDLRSSGERRKVSTVLDLSQLKNTRSFSTVQDEFVENFYVVPFDESKGYAVVSKDKRTFPIYAVLDSGKFELTDLLHPEMENRMRAMNRGRENDIHLTDPGRKEDDSYGGGGGGTNPPKDAAERFMREGWKLHREVLPKSTTKWGQSITPGKASLFFDKGGATYKDVYEGNDGLRVAREDASVLGCTPVAFAQALYAYRKRDGLKNLKYSNGESILWDKMKEKWGADSCKSLEEQRFIGWIAANSSPMYLKEGTMVFNVNAKKFLESKLSKYFTFRYDNCILLKGDADGFGWSESEKIVEDFFSPTGGCVVVMTGASSSINFINYHSYVISGVKEFHKRIQGSGFLGTGIFKKWRDGVRHLYHVNWGWRGKYDGYYLYVQNVGDDFEYIGETDRLDYRSKIAYTVIKPKYNT